MKQKELENKFEQLLKEQKRIIYKVCYFYSCDNYELDDLYQEIVIRLWKAYPKFRGESKESTWVYRVALNTAISFLRQQKTSPQFVSILIERDDLTSDDENYARNLKEMYSWINQLGKLDKAMILLWLEEKSYKEISEIMGIPLNGVGVKLLRIKEKLIKMSNN